MINDEREHTIPSRRKLQDEINKRRAQSLLEGLPAIPQPVKVKAPPAPTPGVRLPEPRPQDIVPTEPTLPSNTRMRLSLEQIAKLIEAGYANEAREILRKRLYKDGENPELWWLYAKVAEDEEQLYHILDGLVSLPPNQYTAQARAKLAKMGYRKSKGGLPVPGRKGLAIPSKLGEAFGVWLKWKFTPILSIGFSVVVLAFSFFLAGQANSGTTSKASSLPAQNAGELLAYFIKAGLPISNMQTVPVPNATWKGNQIMIFNVVRGADKGSFIMISYDTSAQAGKDAFKATFNERYKAWTITQLSTLLLLASPDTPTTINNEITSHTTQFLVAPYRNAVPTATPLSAAVNLP